MNIMDLIGVVGLCLNFFLAGYMFGRNAKK
jgi:hypothetical protein